MKMFKLNRKKLAVILIILLIIVAVVGGVIYTKQNNQVAQSNNVVKADEVKVEEKACGVLTESEAKKILGDNIKQQNDAPTKSGSPAAQDVDPKDLPSVCTYINTKNDSDHPVMVTVLPMSEDQLTNQMNSSRSIEGVQELEANGVTYYQQESKDRSDRVYYRAFAGYKNAMITITVGESNKDKLQPLIVALHENLKDKKD